MVNTDPQPGAPPEGRELAVVEYRLDRNDRIVAVSASWTRFADENGGAHLRPETVIGRPLRDFINGDVTRMFVDTLLQSVRLTGRERRIPYRCDTPDSRRFMEMIWSPDGAGGLVSRHALVRTERLARSFDFRTPQGVPKIVVKRCSMCNRLSRAGGEPVEPEVAEHAGWIDARRPNLVIYHVCRTCQESVLDRRGIADR